MKDHAPPLAALNCSLFHRLRKRFDGKSVSPCGDDYVRNAPIRAGLDFRLDEPNFP